MKPELLKTAYVGRTPYLHVLAATLGVLLFSASLFAQGNFGRILGTVTDQTGAVLAGAAVTVIDTERGVARNLTTDAAGEYNAPTLIPGTYTVRVEANGFKRLDRQNVLVEVGKEVRVDLTPQTGEQTQTVTVTEAIPLVDTASATLGGALTNAEVNNLPLNGRNYQNLLGLRPGIMVQPGGSPWSQSTNNVRPEETVWMMDGVINVNFYDSRPVGNSPSAFTDAATIIPIDAIQEFSTLQNPKAEYGWKPGAVVNVGIRSGTNALHGSAYAFGRDVNWDARSTFNPGPTPGGTCAENTAVPSVCDKLPAELEQFGAVVGGRIKKDKLFFFGGYEGLRSNVGQIQVVQIPETGPQPGGDPKNSMVDAISALQAANVKLSPVSLKLLGCTAPAGAAPNCTGGLFAGATPNSTNYAVPFPNTNVSDNGIVKIDYNINTKHRISGMLWHGAYSANGYDHPIVNALWTTNILISTWSTVENWIWTPSSTVVNEFRFGYNRGGQAFTLGDSGFKADGSGGLCTATGCGGKGYPLNTGVTRTGGLPFIQFGGFGGGGGLGNGNGNRPGANGPSPYSDYQDSVSYLRGKHTLKMGGEFAHVEADQETQDFRGQLILFKGGLTSQIPGSTSLEDFFAGNPAKGIITIGDGVRKMTWRKYAGFVQDDWRIKPRLMLNLGLRYEYQSPIREVNNLYGNFDPNSQYGLVQQGQSGVGDSLWKPDRKDFSPRVGFAWDVTGKGTTVVRGGASVIYSSFFARIFMDNGPQNGGNGNVAQNPTGACRTTVPVGGSCPAGGDFGGKINLGQPTFAGSNLNWDPAIQGNLNGGVVFPQGAVSCTVDSQCNLFAVNPNLKTPFVVNYNFNIQHTITSNLSLEVGYVGTHGDNLVAIRDINQCVPNSDTNACDSGVSRPFYAKFPYLQYVELVSNYDRSNYNSLQVTLTKRVSHGLNFTAGYTYGHGLDNGSLNFNGQNPQDSRNPGAEYASSDFDIRHRLTVTASYAIPGKKGFGQLLEGWKLNSIVSLQTPQPWGMYDLTNNFSMGGSGGGEFTDRWDFYGNPADFRSSSSSLPYCTGPGFQGCSVTSSISGIQSFFSDSQSTAMWDQCKAVAPDLNTLTAATGGCYVKGKSVMTPPRNGTFGTMGRNIFRDSGFKNVDFSVFKDFKFKERFNAQFRVELFNIFNHPNIANPYGSSNTSLLGADPSNNNHFGCGCATPDVAAGNPLIGSGSQRVMQIGLKMTF